MTYSEKFVTNEKNCLLLASVEQIELSTFFPCKRQCPVQWQQSQVPVLLIILPQQSKIYTRMRRTSTTTVVSIVALWWLVGNDVGGASVGLELHMTIL